MSRFGSVQYSPSFTSLSATIPHAILASFLVPLCAYPARSGREPEIHLSPRPLQGQAAAIVVAAAPASASPLHGRRGE